MKALVVYSSRTGNTRKLAQTVYEDAPGAVGRPNEADLSALKAAFKRAVGAAGS